MNNALAGCLIAAAAMILIVWWPLAVIWSLNTLFGTGIPYNLSAWAATVVLVMILRLATTSSEKR